MELSMSAGSDTKVSSTTAGSTHRRNASVKVGKRATGPSTISLFLANLRLLDLDLLPDWPHIEASSLSNQDARTRVRCVEYALYQLFRLYDPTTTADKLQPFFPPLEPLQSVNLRAALFRCLNELKKSGVLPRDCILRKSMLDDCQGDKFWDICLNFSVIVLRKLGRGGKPKNVKPVVEKIASAQVLSSGCRDSMLPLAIAHKAALFQVLEKKRRKRETYARLYDLLSEKGTELKQRRSRMQQEAPQSHENQAGRIVDVERAVQKSWIGSTVLRDALISGDTCAKGDGLLVESFEQLWQQDGQRGSVISNGAEVGLLQDLSSRATQQSVRLSMWQNYLQRVVATKATPSQLDPRIKESAPSKIYFDKHRELNPGISCSVEEPQPAPRQAKHRSTLQYDEILTSMREELRKNTTSRLTPNTRKPSVQVLKRAQTQPIPALPRVDDLDASPGAKDLHSRTSSQTAVPVGARLGRRMSSQPKLYDKPKVDGQREPIPLKSELFSPLKENRRSTSSLASSTPILSSPAEENESVDRGVTVVRQHGATSSFREAPATVEVDRPRALILLNDTSNDGSKGKIVPEKVTDGLEPQTHEFKIPTLPEKASDKFTAAARPSLTERTRMSIAFNSSDDIQGFLPGISGTTSTGQSSDDTDTIRSHLRRAHQDTSLLERTRESIPTMGPPQQASKLKKSTHNRARSSLYPINQFDTPKKARSSTIGTKRVVTPIEQLLSPDTEYDSIFKARPRIALSPKLSPYRDKTFTREEPPELDIVGSSPSVGMNGGYDNDVLAR